MLAKLINLITAPPKVIIDVVGNVIGAVKSLIPGM
jgi:hypothetical protein|tara:strand:- start:809 stop:913 length:105 start_codon:yes stop_codon:yes gene_type:complete